MTAFNAVRFRVKPGREQDFLDAHKKVQADWPGLKHANIIKTGERTFCIIAEWTDMDSLAKARSNMIATLDSFRDTLEDLGGGVGLTDPVSGPVILAPEIAVREMAPWARRLGDRTIEQNTEFEHLHGCQLRLELGSKFCP